MSTLARTRCVSSAGWRRRSLSRKAARGPVAIKSGGRTSHVVLSLTAYERLTRTPTGSCPAGPVEAEPTIAQPALGFQVLCRIDAYADYVAVVEADSPEDAARLAADEPEAYRWEYHQTAEFDARMYVALDANGDEIDGTEINDA